LTFETASFAVNAVVFIYRTVVLVAGEMKAVPYKVPHSAVIVYGITI
jgi:hypothetical protein